MSDHLDPIWHRRLLDELCAIERPSASPGERRAAEWLRARLAAEGVGDVRLEAERSHHTFWWPLGLTSVAGVAAAWRGRRGRSVAAAAFGVAAAWAAADELPPRSRRLRRVLPQGEATNLIAALGPPEAENTVVIVAHHDAPHTGVIFNPAVPELVARISPGYFERTNTSPPLMWPAVLGPALAGLGALTGRRGWASLGGLTSAIFAAAMANIALSETVPAANDNGSGVVLLVALARALAARPTEATRVLLVSTSEEATCEGMRCFGARHFAELPRERTFFLAVDAIGSPRLLVLRGEGMLGVREYPAPALALLDELAEELGIELMPDLRLRNATDGIFPLAAGYPCAALCSCNELKQPANYHWPSDVPENIDAATLADAVRLTESLVRRLDERWI